MVRSGAGDRDEGGGGEGARCGGSRTEEGEGSLAGSPQQSGHRPPLTRLLRGPGAIPPASGEVEEAAAEARRRPMGASPPPLLPPPSPSPQRQELAPSRPRAHPRSSLRPPLARPGPPRLPTPHPPFPAPAPRPGARLSRPEPPFPPLSSSGGGGRDGSAQNPPTPGGGGLPPPPGVSAAPGPPPPQSPPAPQRFPFKKKRSRRRRRSRRRPERACAERRAGGSEPGAEWREAGSAIVKGAAAAAARGRGPGRGAHEGRTGTRASTLAAGEGGLQRQGGLGGGKKGEGGRWWLGNAEDPRKSEARENGVGRKGGRGREGDAPAPRGRLPTAPLSLPAAAMGGPSPAAWQRAWPTPEPHAPSGPALTQASLGACRWCFMEWKVKLPPRRLQGGPTRAGKEMKFFVSKGSSTEMEGPLVPEAAKSTMVCGPGSFHHNLLGVKCCQRPTVLSQQPCPSPDLSYC